MAYAAVIFLKQTINGLLDTPRFATVYSTKKILKSAHYQTKYLQQVLERLNGSSRSRERLDALEGQIRDCAHELEDVLEYHELNSLEDKYEDEEVRKQIISFTKKVKKMEKDYIEELSRPDAEDDHEDDDAGIDFGVEMVGRSEAMDNTRDELLCNIRPVDSTVFLLFGVKGSGRSIVAKMIYEDLCEGKEKSFDCSAWVTIGRKCQLKQVLISIIVQIDNLAPGCDELLIAEEDENLGDYLLETLQHRRYMIVLDDAADMQVVRWMIATIFPDTSNGSIVFITTHLNEVIPIAHCYLNLEPYSYFFQQQLWSFLFLSDSDTELVVVGKKVLENCGGDLYISAIKAFLLLMKTEKTVEQWSEIAADKQNPIYMVADEISEISEIEREVQYSFKYNWLIDDRRRRRIREYILQNIHLPSIVDKVKTAMYPKRFFSKMRIMSILGMAGIGKSTFVRKIVEDNLILQCFDHHAWITLGPKYQSEYILIDILAKIYPGIDKLHMKRDENLVKELCEQLSFKRCLIVVDDLWRKEPLHNLKNLFPDIRGITLVTTRLAKVAEFEEDDACYKMQLLDNEESWCLLCQKVFGGGLCRLELEKARRKIAEKYDGLPLLILTVANELLKVEMSEEYWNNVASGKQKSIFMNAHHQITNALLPSYQCLPQHLKTCFLYMGIFRGKYEIPTFKLINLWIAEGFLEPNSSQVVEDFVVECLSGLVDKSLIMAQHEVFDSQMKACRLHAVFWHLSNSQAMKNEFFHAMNSYDDCSIESIKGQRKLCIRNSILLGMQDVQNSMAANASAHSLMCVGPLHQYPVPLNFDMRLVRVMNALTIRLYEFPIEVLRRIQLRYLSLTCNGRLPTSVSNLWKLQCLIVKRYMNIKSSEDFGALPVEIWDMKELKHLEVMGGGLPDHKGGTGLLKLSTLLDVSAQCCRDEVLKWIPNLKRLGVRIELAPDDEGNSFHYLNNISHLCDQLESLKCVVVNPRIRSHDVRSVLVFPPSLKRLNLCGMGYPWEHMSIVSGLENLEVLILKHYAFQGPIWETNFGMQFKKLKILVISDTDLVQWKVKSPVPTWLNRISLKHCYKLKELPSAFHIQYVKLIEVVDCNPLTETWANQMKQAMTSFCKVEVGHSWIATQK